MRFIFSTGSLWSYDIERCFRFATEAGFDGMEIMIDQRWESRQAGYLRKLIERYGLPAVAVHSPFSPGVPGWPNDQPSRIELSVKLAEQLGAEVVVHHLPSRVGVVWVHAPGRFFPLPVPWNRDSSYRKWIVEEYAELQASTPVTLCIENMPAFRRLGRRWNWCHWNTPEQLTRFPNITLDTTHLGTWGLEPEKTYLELGDHVRHVHLSNYDGREHRRPETGDLRLDRFVSRLSANGYKGAVSLELHPDALQAGRPDEAIVARMATSLSYCQEWTKQ